MLGMMQTQPPASNMSNHSAISDPKVEQLKAMFPDIDADVLASMLAFHSGSVEDACVAILDVPTDEHQPTVEDNDAAMARAMQAEIDAEVALSVQKDLDDEAKAAQEAAQARDPSVRAAKAATAAASSTLSMLKKANPLSMLSGRKMASSTHATRLLDTPAESGDVSINFSPLQVPDYVPSAFAVPQPPPFQAQAQSTASPRPVPDVSDAAEWGPAASPPLPMTTAAATTERSSISGGGDATRYSSRLDRARAANALSNRSASVSSVTPLSAQSSPPPAAQPPAPYVPVGELI